MSKWNATNTTLKDESTVSKDVIASEGNMVVSVDMDTNVKIVKPLT